MLLEVKRYLIIEKCNEVYKQDQISIILRISVKLYILGLKNTLRV